MNEVRFRQLKPIEFPLARKFYRAHQRKMQPHGDETIWVAETPKLGAALRLKTLTCGCWLLGLYVLPEQRHRGLARQLIREALADITTDTWLFCHPDLASFYQPLGFQSLEPVPQPLYDRLLSYRRSQPLVALCRPGTL